MLGPEGLTMDKQKVQTIQDWPIPCWLKEVQFFLGFSNFYRQFIFNYSDIVAPLIRLTKKKTLWSWSGDCQRAFEALKKAFTTAPVLARWNPDSKIIVETDASDRALAAILSTYSGKDVHSRIFNEAKMNYNIHDKELLAIAETFKKWRHYLKDTPIPVEVFTNHKNLTYFCDTKSLSRCQVHWSKFLLQFNLTIRFRPGRLGMKLDALTCHWDVYDKEDLI